MSRLSAFAVGLVCLAGCSDSMRRADDADPADSATDAPLDAPVDVPPETSDAGDPCGCAPGDHNDHIFVVSDDAELWKYDPVANDFEFVTTMRCGGSMRAFSMAVDSLGIAYVLYSDLEDIFTIDVNDPGFGCLDPGYVPRSPGFALFGMSFANESDTNRCADLYVHSFSGGSAFGEGSGIGTLGALTQTSLEPRMITSIDFDGGELAGTGDGRLFALAGLEPVKLVEYDKVTGEVLGITPLDGLNKTNASAFAFLGGDAWIFTEAPPAACASCRETECATAWSACEVDAACRRAAECSFEAGSITDDCGGVMPAELQSCLAGPCVEECYPSVRTRVSQVSRYDFDGSDDGGLTVVHAEAPIRIVGAGASTCVSTLPF